MTEQVPSQYPSAGRPDQTTSGWALLLITLDVFVIWAIAAHGREVGV